MKKKLLTLTFLSVLIFSLQGCGGGGGGSADTTSKFDSAILMNLSQLDNYDLITSDGGGSTNLRSVDTTNSNETSSLDSSSLRLSYLLQNSLEHLMQENKTNSNINLRSISVDGNIITRDDTNTGNISGTQRIYLRLDQNTGNYSGNIVYENYKNSEYNSCGTNDIDNLHGTISVSGIFHVSNDYYYLDTMIMNFTSSFSNGNAIWASGAILKVIYNHTSQYSNDIEILLTAEIVEGTEYVGFKNYKIKTYEDNGYLYSYPLEGNLYIFTNGINGYFFVDTSYDHSATPTQEDLCEQYTYSGKEKYLGKDSSLIWEITTTNNYKIEIDGNNDGIIDINVTGVVN